MRNRATAMNFNKKVVTKAIYVKGVVFQYRYCLGFLYENILWVIMFFRKFNIHLIVGWSNNHSPVIAYL